MLKDSPHSAIDAEITLNTILDNLSKTNVEMYKQSKAMQLSNPELYSQYDAIYQNPRNIANLISSQAMLKKPSGNEGFLGRALIEFLLQAEDGDGPPIKRYYLGEGESKEPSIAKDKAERAARKIASFSPADSLSMDLIKQIIGKDSKYDLYGGERSFNE